MGTLDHARISRHTSTPRKSGSPRSRITRSGRSVAVISIPSRPVGASSSRSDTSLSARSEEHTSELQSRLHLVCRLLLEKKKKKKITTSPPQTQTKKARTTLEHNEHTSLTASVGRSEHCRVSRQRVSPDSAERDATDMHW